MNRPAMSGGKFPWAIPLFFMGRKAGWALYSGDVVPYVDYMFGALYEDEKKNSAFCHRPLGIPHNIYCNTRGLGRKGEPPSSEESEDS